MDENIWCDEFRDKLVNFLCLLAAEPKLSSSSFSSEHLSFSYSKPIKDAFSELQEEYRASMDVFSVALDKVPSLNSPAELKGLGLARFISKTRRVLVENGLAQQRRKSRKEKERQIEREKKFLKSVDSWCDPVKEKIVQATVPQKIRWKPVPSPPQLNFAIKKERGYQGEVEQPFVETTKDANGSILLPVMSFDESFASCHSQDIMNAVDITMDSPKGDTSPMNAEDLVDDGANVLFAVAVDDERRVNARMKALTVEDEDNDRISCTAKLFDSKVSETNEDEKCVKSKLTMESLKLPKPPLWLEKLLYKRQAERSSIREDKHMNNGKISTVSADDCTKRRLDQNVYEDKVSLDEVLEQRNEQNICKEHELEASEKEENSKDLEKFQSEESDRYDSEERCCYSQNYSNDEFIDSYNADAGGNGEEGDILKFSSEELDLIEHQNCNEILFHVKEPKSTNDDIYLKEDIPKPMKTFEAVLGSNEERENEIEEEGQNNCDEKSEESGYDTEYCENLPLDELEDLAGNGNASAGRILAKKRAEKRRKFQEENLTDSARKRNQIISTKRPWGVAPKLRSGRIAVDRKNKAGKRKNGTVCRKKPQHPNSENVSHLSNSLSSQAKRRNATAGMCLAKKRARKIQQSRQQKTASEEARKKRTADQLAQLKIVTDAKRKAAVKGVVKKSKPGKRKGAKKKAVEVEEVIRVPTAEELEEAAREQALALEEARRRAVSRVKQVREANRTKITKEEKRRQELFAKRDRRIAVFIQQQALRKSANGFKKDRMKSKKEEGKLQFDDESQNSILSTTMVNDSEFERLEAQMSLTKSPGNMDSQFPVQIGDEERKYLFNSPSRSQKDKNFDLGPSPSIDRACHSIQWGEESPLPNIPPLPEAHPRKHFSPDSIGTPKKPLLFPKLE
eukprot:g3493.t1